MTTPTEIAVPVRHWQDLDADQTEAREGAHRHDRERESTAPTGMRSSSDRRGRRQCTAEASASGTSGACGSSSSGYPVVLRLPRFCRQRLQNLAAFRTVRGASGSHRLRGLSHQQDDFIIGDQLSALDCMISVHERIVQLGQLLG